MGISGEVQDQLVSVFAAMLPHLDERQRRLLMGAQARALGHGGIRAVARAAGTRAATVALGVQELNAGAEPSDRVRRKGGGRKRLTDLDPGLLPALLALVEPDERGDPMSPLRWTTKSTRNLAAALTAAGHPVSANIVGDLLRKAGFSLQGNAKTLEGSQHPDRDAQFRYLNEQIRAHRDAGQPTISIDTKKKELVGEYKNTGRQWRPAGDPRKVKTHDFCADNIDRAVPYGIYDMTTNTGWVNVGTDHDTATFAVESIRRWWDTQGHHDYPNATRLMITADSGGSNSCRNRAWKTGLATLATDTGLAITVCHLPPGTSKWNKIEHRLFSQITLNWRGRPLTSHQVVVESIAATTTHTGMTVHAQLDTGNYPTGTHTPDADIAALPIDRHTFHGDWNYTLDPINTPPPDPDNLTDPTYTGMTTDALTTLTNTLQTTWDHHHRPHHRRGGRPHKLQFPQRLLATILHKRLHIPADVLAHLFHTGTDTIHTALRQAQQLLTEHSITITPAPKTHL